MIPFLRYSISSSPGHRAVRLLAILLALFAGAEMYGHNRVHQQEAVSFTENSGQWNAQARFCAHVPGATVWVTDSSLVYDHQTAYGGHVVAMEFVGARAASVRASTPSGHASTFIGPNRRATARSFGELSLQGLYDGIDLVVHSDSGTIRYDFIIAPHTSPDVIALKFRGVDSRNILIDSSGELSLALSTGTVRHGSLFAYQRINGTTVPVDCRFTAGNNGTVGFKLGSYDSRHTLIIDPLVFSTALGGRNSEVAQAVTTDSIGNIYVTGYTSSPDFPTTLGAYRSAQVNNRNDIFVTKLDPTGRRILYSTYIGGSREDSATAIVVNTAGEVLLAGATYSFDFPTTTNALDSTYNGDYDAFYARLSKKGDSLLYATYIGGGREDYATDFVLRGDTVYLTGETNSDAPFPITPDALQRNRSSAQDAFLMIFNMAGTRLYYSSYFGGNSGDEAYGIAVNSAGIVTLAGRTSSTNLPVSATAVKKELALPEDAFDAFIMQFNPVSRELVYCTYLGGTGNDEQIEAIHHNSKGQLVAAGWTNSRDFPVTPAGFDTTATDSPYHNGFLVVLTPEEGILAASYLNGIKGMTKIFDMVVDSSDDIFCTGITYSNSFPVTPDAFDDTYSIPSNGDSFLTYISSDLTTILYSTFFGGSEIDAGAGVCTGPYRTAIVAGYTRSPDIHIQHGRPFTAGLDGFVASFSTGAILYEPNGREAICAGSTALIKWNTTQHLSTISLVISRAGDASITIASDIPANLREWLWTIPGNLPGGAYRLSIVDDEQRVLDISDTTFFIHSRPVFTMHPTSTQKCPGSNLFLECNAHSLPLPSYQWQKYDNGRWQDIPDETSRFLTIYGLDPPTHNGLYRARASTECGHIVYSDTASISAYPIPAVDLHPVSATECPGATAVFKARSSDPQATVQWEYRTAPGDTWMILHGETTEELSIHNVTESQNGWEYRAIFHNLCDNRTLPARLTIQPSPVVLEHPVPDTTCAGKKAVFSIKTSPDNAVIQWQKSIDLDEWTIIPMATASVYTTEPLSAADNGMYFRALVRSGCETFAISQAAQVVLRPTPSIELSSPVIDFGVLGFCTDDSVLSVTMTNNGETPVHFGIPTFTSGHFSVQYSPTVLDPGLSDVLTVRFAPTSVPVNIESTLLLPAGECNFSIPIVLKGQKATAPVVSTVSFIDFGTFSSCVSEPIDTAIAISIVNTGQVAITLHGSIVNPPFTLATSRPFPILLQPLETASFDLHYHPADTEGSDREFVLFPFSTASSCSDTLKVEARGKRELPVVAIADTIWFPVVPSCNTGIDTVINIINTGRIPVTFSPEALVIGEGFHVDYPEKQVTLKDGDTLKLSVSFRPAADGTYQGSISFFQIPCGTTRTMEFRGKAATPVLASSASSLVFSRVVRSRTATLTNTGSIPLSLFSVEADNLLYSVRVARTLPYTLAPNESVVATIEYAGAGDPTDAIVRAISNSPCQIILPVELKADEPHEPTSGIAIPVQYRKLGEVFPLPLLVDTTDIEELQEVNSTSFRARISFNATMMTPVAASQHGLLSSGLHIISVEGALADRRGDTLAAVLMLAALGNSSFTPVDIVSFEWLDASGSTIGIPTVLQSGALHITNIKKGQYVNPALTPFAVTITPVPADETLALDIDHIPSLIGASLEVYSATGVRVDDWTQELTSLSGSATEGYGGMIYKNINTLAAGVYYCRLSLWNFSLVRPFVVR